MKILIRKISYAICIVLLTCAFCLAQDLAMSINGGDLTVYATNTTEQKSAGSDTTIIKLMIEYKTECYNDSTYVEWLKINESPSYTDAITGMTSALSIFISPTLIKEWQHKEPTFKDFVRWVAKKYGL